MSDFIYNERTGFYEALYEAHEIRVESDMFMLQLQLMQDQQV